MSEADELGATPHFAATEGLVERRRACDDTRQLEGVRSGRAGGGWQVSSAARGHDESAVAGWTVRCSEVVERAAISTC